MKRHKISLDMDVCDDMGVDGDDGVELIDKFSETFGVKMQGFNYSRHFGPEGCNPFWFLFPSYWKWRRELRPIRVRDLVKAAESGTWDYDYHDDQSS